MSPAKKPKFTKHEIEVAVRVLVQTKIIRHWIEGEAEFLGIDLNTPRGKEFWEREARAAAMRLLR